MREYGYVALLGGMLLVGCTIAPTATTTVVPLNTPATTRTTVAEIPSPTPLPHTPAPTIATVAIPTIVPTPEVAPTAPISSTVATDVAGREAQLLVLVNQLRTEARVAPYPLDPRLGDIARTHSCDMATNGYIGHTDSEGRSVAERAPPDLPWQWLSESVAAGSDDPAVIVALWMDEPPDGWHRRNILDADRVVAGIGYCKRDDDPAGNIHYWTMIVGK